MLLGRRAKPPMQGTWFLFGGKLTQEERQREDFEEAARREVAEEVKVQTGGTGRQETGLSLNDLHKAWESQGTQGGKWRLCDFVTRLTEEQAEAIRLEADVEHTHKRWFSLQEVRELNPEDRGDRLLERVQAARLAIRAADRQGKDLATGQHKTPKAWWEGLAATLSGVAVEQDRRAGKEEEWRRHCSLRNRLCRHKQQVQERKRQQEVTAEDSVAGVLADLHRCCNPRSGRLRRNVLGTEVRWAGGRRVTTSKPAWYRKVNPPFDKLAIGLAVAIAGLWLGGTQLSPGGERPSSRGDWDQWGARACINTLLTVAAAGTVKEQWEHRQSDWGTVLTRMALALVVHTMMPAQDKVLQWLTWQSTLCTAAATVGVMMRGFQDYNQVVWEGIAAAESRIDRLHAALVNLELDDGQRVMALADTGAMTSVWAWNTLPGVLQRFGLRPPKLSTLAAASGDSMEMAGQASPRFKFADADKQHWFEAPVQVAAEGAMPQGMRILGVDFLLKNQATIDFDKKEIKLTPGRGPEVRAKFMLCKRDRMTDLAALWGAQSTDPWSDQGRASASLARTKETVLMQPYSSAWVTVEQESYPGMGATSDETIVPLWEPHKTQLSTEEMHSDLPLWEEVDKDGGLMLSTAQLVAKDGCSQTAEGIRAKVLFNNPTAAEVILPPGAQLGQLVEARAQEAKEMIGEEAWEEQEAWLQELEQDSDYEDDDDRQEGVHAVQQSSTLEHAPVEFDEQNKDDWRAGTSAAGLISGIKDDDPKFQQWLREVEGDLQCGEHITKEQRSKIHKLLYAFNKLFIKNPKAPPPIKGVEYRLTFKSDNPVPWCRPVPRLTPEELDCMDKETRAMLANDILEYSDSEWATVPVFARKKDGTLRYAIDYRWVNSQLKGDSHSVPNIVELLESLKSARWLSTFDASSGFWGILLRKEDRPKAAFHAYVDGAWTVVQPKRMMFGFKTATSAFQRMYQRVLGPELLRKCCKGYVDDVTAWTSGDFDEHLGDLAAIFKRLEANGISLKLAKCIWAARRLPLLGHVVIAGEGIAADPEKIKAILEMAAPDTVGELKKLLGAAGYLHRFIPEFATIVEPLRQLEKKYPSKLSDISHEWENPEYLTAFETLRAALTTAPTLAFPDWTKPFIICTDASATGAAGVLCQLSDEGIEQPVAYGSMAFTEGQKRYGITDREGLALVMFLRRWRSYVQGNVCIAICDHSSLQALRNPKKILQSPRQARYAVELDTYELLVAHRPGKILFIPDLLTRAAKEQNWGEAASISAQAYGRTQQIAQELGPDNAQLLFHSGANQRRLSTHIRNARFEEGERQLTVTAVCESLKGNLKATSRAQPDEHGEPVFDMYEMACNVIGGAEMRQGHEDFAWDAICTAAWDDNVDLTKAGIRVAQAQDPLCSALRMHWESKGAGLPKDDTLAKRAIKLASSFAEHDGLVVQVWNRTSSLEGTQTMTRIYLPETLREEVILRMHYELGHPGILKTYRMLRERFVWPSMYEDVASRVRTCAKCQYFAAKAAKAPVVGHVTAERCGQVIAFDLMYLPAEGGRECVLNVVDVFSRWGQSIAMEGSVTAKDVVEVLDQRVFSAGWGYPEVFVTDNDSKFRRELAEAVDAWNIKHKKSAPHHSESHGVIERYNQTLQRKLALLGAKQKGWNTLLGDAQLLVQTTPEEALTRGDVAVAPDEVWLGRKLDVGLDREWSVQLEPQPKASEYAKQLAARLQKLHAWVRETREKYNQQMAARHALAKRKLRRLAVGNEVTLYRPTGSLKENKISGLQEGPYEIIEVGDSGADYLIQRKASTAPPFWAHIDDLKRLVRANDEEITEAEKEAEDQTQNAGTTLEKTSLGQEEKREKEGEELKQASAKEKEAKASGDEKEEREKQPAKRSSRVYEVEQICGEKGRDTRTKKGKEYLVQWDPKTLKKGDARCSWQLAENLNCPRLLQEWTELAPSEKKERLRRAVELGIATLGEKGWTEQEELQSSEEDEIDTGEASRRTENVKRKTPSTFIRFDLSEVEDEFLEAICDRAGVAIEQIALVWASPPCETYTRTDSVNEPYNYRDHSTEEREPREIPSWMWGWGQLTRKVRQMALGKRHTAICMDQMVEALSKALIEGKKRQGHDYEIIVENPRGSLRKRGFMNTGDWCDLVKLFSVNLCAWGHPFMKPTDLWTTLRNWKPKGSTGNGLCGGKCSQGMWFQATNGTKSYRHHRRLAGPPERGPTGPGQMKQKWKMPEEMLRELLAEVSREQQSPQTAQPQHNSEVQYVVDLFAGGQSLRDVSEEAGYGYIAVDLHDYK